MCHNFPENTISYSKSIINKERERVLNVGILCMRSNRKSRYSLHTSDAQYAYIQLSLYYGYIAHGILSKTGLLILRHHLNELIVSFHVIGPTELKLWPFKNTLFKLGS